MKYLITRIFIKGVNTVNNNVLETGCIEATRKEVAKRHQVESSQVKFNYEEIE